MLTIVKGSTTKPVSTDSLIDTFKTRAQSMEGFLFTGYPTIGTPTGSHHIDALLISKEQGVIIFDLAEGPVTDGFVARQNENANKLESRLRTHERLMCGRALQVPIHTVTFAPMIQNLPPSQGDCSVCNGSNLSAWFDALDGWSQPDSYKYLVSVLQSITSIRQGAVSRVHQGTDSRGGKLAQLEASIANLDSQQSRAVIETVDGVQRIRGLAGSGKTIVLALKAAYLHIRHPDWKIAVTFNTRSLKAQFKRFIHRFVLDSGAEPNWNHIQVIHAWGAPGGGNNDGIYYTFCRITGTKYHDFQSARQEFGQGKEFTGACEEALKAWNIQTRREEPRIDSQAYDAVLIDEAQDFSPAFLQLCYEMLKGTKRLVYAYDELQNLGSRSLPAPEEIFGRHPDGTPRVRFAAAGGEEDPQDIILKKCYRNSRPILATAHALGFGIYHQTASGKPSLIQIFEDKHLWQEVGYDVVGGELEDGRLVALARSQETSPKFLEVHSCVDDLIQFQCFNSSEAQTRWVANAIQVNLAQDGLQPGDIMVINLDPLTTRTAVGPIRALLFQRNVPTHTAGVDTSPDIFPDPDNESIAFTGIYRAKGNEVGMVYIINAQDSYEAQGQIAVARNRLFSAITRSKAWVRVLGVGSNMRKLSQEFAHVKAKDFQLEFVYPTEQERQTLTIVNRDMPDGGRQRLQHNKNRFAQILSEFESGHMHVEDIDPHTLTRLKKALKIDT